MKPYLKPDFEVVDLSGDDVIVTSAPGDDNDGKDKDWTDLNFIKPIGE